MFVPGFTSQKLTVDHSISSRKIKDAAQLQARIHKIWQDLQDDKAEVKVSGSKLWRNFPAPEEDLVDILLKLQASQDTQGPIQDVRNELKKYPDLDGAEISLLVFESWINGRVQSCAGVITGQDETGCAAKKIFLHLVRKEQSFSCALDFLKVVWGVLGAEDRRDCARQLATNEAFYKVLPDGDCAAGQLKRELTFVKFTNGELLDGYEELKGLLERFEQGAPVNLIEMVVGSPFSDLAQKAWGIWFKQSKNMELCRKDCLVIAPLLKHADLKEVVEFYKSGPFLPHGVFIYDQVYACARKSGEDLVSVHQGYMKKYPELKGQRVEAILAKLNDKNTVFSPPLLNAFLSDIESGSVDSEEIWLKVLERVASGKHPEIKKRALKLWCQNHLHFKEQEGFGKIWMEAIKLVELNEWVDFFCGNDFAATLPFFKSDEVYKSALILAKRSAVGSPRFIKAHQLYIGVNLLLKNYTIFEVAIQLTGAGVAAYELIKFYTEDPLADQNVISRASQWLIERLSHRELKSEATPAILELADVLLELTDKFPGAVNCFLMAERLKSKAFYDLALRFAFKALYKEAREKRGNQKQLDACIELMIANIPHTSDRGFLNLLEREEILDFQNLKIQGKGEIFWKEMALRSVRVAPEYGAGLVFACDFWRFFKHLGDAADEIFEKMVKTVFAVLPAKNKVGVENYKEIFVTLSAKLAVTFQERVIYKMGEGGRRIPIRRSLDKFLGYLCLEASRNERHSFLLLRVACNLAIRPEFLNDFIETSLADVVAKSCLDQIDRITEASMMDTLAVQSFLHDAYELFQAKLMKYYYDQLIKDGKNINALATIHVPALYREYLKAKEVKKGDFTEAFNNFNNEAYSAFKGADLAVQKLVWMLAIEFAVKHDEKTKDVVWIENLKALMGWLDQMLAAGLKEQSGRYTMSLSHLEEVIEICDFAAPLLSELALEYYNSDMRDGLLTALINMADLQINYQSRSLKQKEEVLSGIVKIAINDGVKDVFADPIMQLAINAQRRGGLSNIGIKMGANVVKIDLGVSSAMDDDPHLKRKGVIDLFSWLLKKSKKNDSFQSLRLTCQMLKWGSFKFFQNAEYCSDMLQLFTEVFKEIDAYDQCDILEEDLFMNVFHALTYKSVRGEEEWRELNSLDELIGTLNEGCIKKAQAKVRNVISLFLSMCGKDGEYLAKLKLEKQAVCISSFDKFLKHCENKHYLEDIEKWKTEFESLQKNFQ